MGVHSYFKTQLPNDPKYPQTQYQQRGILNRNQELIPSLHWIQSLRKTIINSGIQAFKQKFSVSCIQRSLFKTLLIPSKKAIYFCFVSID